MSPYKGAIVKPLAAAEVLDIAELKLALISLVLKPAHRHLSPADFDQCTRSASSWPISGAWASRATTSAAMKATATSSWIACKKKAFTLDQEG